MDNLFYVANFNAIGGVETFIFELARKYADHDITVVYKTGDSEQLRRLRKYVPVIKFQGQKFKCRKAFFNYETDIIDSIEAEEYIQLIHACFKTGQIQPKVNQKITKYLSVSERAGKEWEELTGFKSEHFRNPLELTKEEKKSPLMLISATRLTKEKGKKRIETLANLLDEAGVNYIWFIFTNDSKKIYNSNIIWLEPRLNIRPFLASIKGNGYGVQLSDTEGDCYFTRECEALGLPLLITPVPSFAEQGLKDGENCYYLPFDMKGIDIDKIVNNIPKYKAYCKPDCWNEILVEGKSTYNPNEDMIKVKPIRKYFDNELQRRMTPDSPPFEVDRARGEMLCDVGVCMCVC